MKKTKIKNILIFLIVLSLFIFSVFNKNFKNKLVNFTYSIFYPAGKILWAASSKASNFLLDLKNFQNLRENNKILINKNLILKGKLIDFENLKTENNKLKKQIGENRESKLSLLPANSWGFSSVDKTIFIDKGAKDGVVEDLTLITENRVLVGKIIKVFENFSKAQLITQENFSFDIEINNTLGLARGANDNKLFFDLIPMDSKIAEGDIVKTSAISGKFPPHLIVGEVKKIEKDERNNYLKGEILPDFLKEDLSILFIIK